MAKIRQILTKELLQDLYYNKNLDLESIAKKHGFSQSRIYQLMSQFQIPLKPKEEWFQDITNQRFHYGIAIKPTRSSSRYGKIWLMQCDCGNEYAAALGQLKRNIKSCGCHKQFVNKKDGKWTGYEEISGDKWSSIQQGATSRNIDFQISIKQGWKLFISQDRKCALSNRKLIFSNKKGKTGRLETTASLDRIDSTKPYILSNVQWVHKDINRMKNAFDNDYFIQFCKDVAQKFA